MKNFESILNKYDYSFPKELIANAPAKPRDSAKLLVYNRENKKITWTNFSKLPEYLPQNAVLVLNDTKVLPARLEVKKETGGKANILYLNQEGVYLKFLSDRKLDIGKKLYLKEKIYFTIEAQKEKYYYLKPSFPIKNTYSILEKFGKIPTPPYIKHSPLRESQLKKEYQTIFAKNRGSVAAPTASLHFTKRLFKKLKKRGIQTIFVTLHVGLGTFAPLTEENLKTGKLHEEYFSIDKKTVKMLEKAKREGRPIIAVGTTVARTLESASNTKGELVNLSHTTDIFIREGYAFKYIDGLITNFHVPKSSLLMLVSAFIKRKKLLELYEKAIAKKFRLFSFGDGMLIL